MGERRFTVPSPALVVAFVALIAALGGSAVALPGKNRVDSGDIKRNAVTSSDIRNGGVGSADIRNGAVTGTDVRNDGLTGTDLNESSLGKVPSAGTADIATNAATATTAVNAATATTAVNAANATNAANAQSAADADMVGGQKVEKIDFDVPDGGIADPPAIGGISFSADCVGGDMNLDASNKTGVAAAALLEGDNAGTHFSNEDADLTAGDNFNVSADNSAFGSVTMTVLFTNGAISTAQIAWHANAAEAPNSCLVRGRVVSG